MEPLKRFIKSFFKNKTAEAVILFFSPIPLLRRVFFALRPRHTDYASPAYRAATRDSINYNLDLSDWVEWNIYFKNKLEPREQLYSLIKKSDTIIDVGVNIGETLLNFASITGNSGRVIGFEPNPVVREKCMKNISLNPSFTNISLQPLALGAATDELFIQVRDPRNQGMNSLSKSATGERVKVITLDSFISANNIQQVNLIKLDVEGFELNVLKGAEDTLRRFKPVLFIEVIDDLLLAQQASAKELAEWLSARGYRLFNAADDNPIDMQQSFAGCQYDVIARPA